MTSVLLEVITSVECPDLESNQDFPIFSRTFSPLNYQGG